MKLWIDALESNEYKQDIGLLKQKPSENKHSFWCCLGVLCDLYIKHNPQAHASWESDEDYDHTNSRIVYRFASPRVNERITAYIPLEVREWAGFVVENPQLMIEGDTVSFVEMNDVQKLSFKDIAGNIRHWAK